MTTGVLPSSRHHSGSTPQTTSDVKLSPSGVQPQSASGPRPTLDEVVDRILVRAKSQLGGDEARKIIEALERMLEPHCQISLRTRRRCFRGLVKVCGEYAILPNSYIIPESDIKRLGDSPYLSGGFSDLWAGEYGEGGCVAIKTIRYAESDNIPKMKRDFCREVITWKRLSHPNVLELIGVMMDDSGYSMVSPWMDNGSIVKFLKEGPEANPLKLLEDATRGLQYLHSIDLAHGDLKGGNILISDDGCACLADVGLTRVAADLNSVTALSNTSTSSGAVTLRWSAPEMLDPERFGSKRAGPTKQSDVYSMAMTIYEVLTDNTPFHEYRDLVAMRCIIEGVRPKKPIFIITRGYTEEVWEMTTSCWEEDPAKRPAVDQVLGVLSSAAERWEPRCGELAIQDDTEGSDSNHEDEPAVVAVPASINPPASKESMPLDRKANQLLTRAESSLGEDEVQEVTGALEKMLEPLCQISPRTRSRCFQGLVKIWGEYGILPNLHVISESAIERLGDSPISSSGFSDFWQGVYKRDTFVTIKIMQHRRSYEVEDTKKTKEDFLREVITWKHLSHPNTLKLIGVMTGHDNCAMVSPWMKNGNIVEFLKKTPEANPLKLLEDAARGLQYLHGMDLAHGDLEGRNILVSDDGCACLADFGLTRHASDLDSPTTSPTGGVILRWSPPERLDPERFGSTRGGPTKKSDIYSMAMTIYEVLTDRLPFYNHSELAAVVHIINGVRPKKPDFDITRGYTDELWEMTTRCWEEDPIKRPAVDYVLGVLSNAAERWEPSLAPVGPPKRVVREEQKLTPVTAQKEKSEEEQPNTRDRLSATLPTDKSIPPIVSKPVTTVASANSPQPPVPTPTSTPSVPMPSTPRNGRGTAKGGAH